MFNDFMKWFGRNLLIAVVWVFIFSINIKGQTLFTHSNEVLVQNEIVRAIDEQIGQIWYKISETARITFRNVSGKEEDRG